MLMTPDRGLFVWHELNTSDIGSAEAFYTKLIGWKTRAWEPNPAYKIWMMGREGRGGLYTIHEEPNDVTPPPHWLSYIGTPDVDATVRQAVDLGGKVLTPAYDVAGIGRMAVLQDPQGAMFAVSAQVERSRYTDPELGDFSWHELLTTNHQTAFDFYSKLFGWEKMTAMDMGPDGIYQMYGIGGHMLGGMFTPQGSPTGPKWMPYVLVRDARRGAEIARELGATIAHGPIEVPGGDWVFTGVDHQGALFAVHSKKRAVAAKTTKDAKKGVTGRKSAPSAKKRAPKRAAKRHVKITRKARSVGRNKTAKKPARRR